MNKIVKVGNKFVGKGYETFVIAEAGSNHDKKFDQAKKLIDIAARSKVDAVKFQLFKAGNFYPPGSKFYQELKSCELPYDWVAGLYAYAKSRKIQFLATPCDKESINLLDKLGAPAFKWPSSEIVNLPLLRYAASKGKTIILSAGMSNIADIYEAIEVIRSTGNDSIILMQCTALYPAKPEQLHLNVMETLQQTFQIPIGLSDHSLGILMPPVAVALGANIIEKHFTISRKLEGPDHPYAIEPDELQQMVKNIRNVEKCLGSQIKNILPEEKVSARRESIFAKVNIEKNEIISLQNVVIKRPARGIEPRYLQAIVGLTVKNNIKKNSPLTWDVINHIAK